MKLKFNKDAGVNLGNTKVDMIVDHLKKNDLIPNGIDAQLNGATLIVSGEAENVIEKNKILATAGNIQGIEEVEDRLTIKGERATQITAAAGARAEEVSAEADKSFYTVQKGDYLSKISKEVYGDANKYNKIFEANKPMLTDPDKIYPGQVLVIPALEN